MKFTITKNITVAIPKTATLPSCDLCRKNIEGFCITIREIKVNNYNDYNTMRIHLGCLFRLDDSDFHSAHDKAIFHCSVCDNKLIPEDDPNTFLFKRSICIHKQCVERLKDYIQDKENIFGKMSVMDGV